MTRLWPEGEPLHTWGPGETPAGFAWHGSSHAIQEVYNRWRVHTNWWQPSSEPAAGPLAGRQAVAVWREYLKVTTDTGLLCLLYRELPAGGWFLARVYD